MNLTRNLSLAATAAMLALGACSGQQQPSQATSSSTVDSPTPSSSFTLPASPSSSAFSSPAVSRDRAIAIALERTGGGAVDEVEDEVEHGRAAWKVRVVKDGIRYDVYLDKATGEIFRFENEGRH